MKSSRLYAVEGGALGSNRKRRFSSLIINVASRRIGLGSNSRLNGFLLPIAFAILG